MFLNVGTSEDTAVGGYGGLAYPAVVPDIEQVSNIEQELSAGNNAVTAAVGEHRHHNSTPTASGTPPPVPLPRAQ